MTYGYSISGFISLLLLLLLLLQRTLCWMWPKEFEWPYLGIWVHFTSLDNKNKTNKQIFVGLIIETFYVEVYVNLNMTLSINLHSRRNN